MYCHAYGSDCGRRDGDAGVLLPLQREPSVVLGSGPIGGG